MRELRWAWDPDPNQRCKSKNVVGMKAADNLKLDLFFSDLSPLTIHQIARNVGVMMVGYKVNLTQLKIT